MTTAKTIRNLAPALKRKHTASDAALLKRFAIATATRRIELDLSSSKLAREIGISKQQMCHIERGDNWPSMLVYRRLCAALKVGVPVLMG